MIPRNLFKVLVLLVLWPLSLFAANLMTNPGFESGTSGWTTWGSAITASSEQKRSGSYSCLNTARTADWQGCVQDLTGKLTVGTTYRISAWLRLRNTVGQKGQLTIQRTDASGVNYFGSDAPLVSNDAWTPVVLYYAHSGTAITGVNLFITTPGGTNDFFVDDVTVESAYDPQAVGVDLAVTNGPVTQRGSGFLFGLSATDPATSYYEPLKPKLQRDRAALLGNAVWGTGTGFGSTNFMNRVQQAGSKHQVIISDDYCWDRNYQNTWGWPGDAAHNGYGPYDLLDQTIDALMASARTNGYQVEWDIWNEPDPTNGTTFWGRDQAQFFATWQHAYQRIRSNDPNAVIVGPSVTSYVGYLTNFLLYAQSNNVLPDVVSWHELSGCKSINADVQAVRVFMASNGMPARPIDINEYIGNTEWSNPGIHAGYLAALERATVRRAAHAVWDEVGTNDSSSGIFSGRLAHLLTQDTHQPRAVWQVYKAYADLAGNMVQVSPGIQIDGVAAMDNNGTVRVVLGNNSGDTNSVNLTISHLDLLPYYNPTGAVRMVVQRISNTGTAALAAPLLVSDTNIYLTTNSLTLPLSLGPAEVLLVNLTNNVRATLHSGTLDQISWNNPWGVTTLDSGITHYVALSGDGGTANVVYAAAAGGGLAKRYWDGAQWATNQVSTNTFIALTSDASRANIVFGAPASGGLIQFEWNGSSWNVNTVDGDTAHVYVALTHDTVNQNKVFGAAAAGGIYEITWTGSSWAANQRIASAYTYQQLTIDGGSGVMMFGLTTDGYIEQIGWPINGIWDHVRLDSVNTYTSIAGENSQPALYAARTGGGLYQWWSGSIYPVDTTRTYGALADSTGTGNSILGMVGSEVYEIGYSGGWQANDRVTGRNYSALTPDGVLGAAVFGAAPKLTPVAQTATTASAITYGQSLSSSTITPGSFANTLGKSVAMASYGFVNPGIVPTAGVTNVMVYFVPTDSADYNSVTNTVAVTVAAAVAAQPTNQISVSAGTVAIQVSGTVSAHYRVESTTSLSPANWVLLQDIPSLPSSPYTVTDPSPATNSPRFYRSHTVP
jgi:hypothetical protein